MLPKPDSCRGCPLFEKPYGKETGFSLLDGNGTSGVFICAEALGKDEELEGRGLVGASGHTLFQQLKRVGIEREGFTIFNTVACRPPDNKLVKQPYEREAIEHCSPNLDSAIVQARSLAKENGKTFVIVTLGAVAFRRVMGYDYKTHGKLLKKDYIAYPFWNEKYRAWVLAAQHPAYLLRGSTHLWPIVQFVFTRAIEIAGNGLVLGEPRYQEDPPLGIWERYVALYLASLKDNPDNPLSYDIETAWKRKVGDEDEVGKGEDGGDHSIIRIGFSFRVGEECYTTSVKWSAEYMAGIERLFEHARFVLGWNCPTPDQRLLTSDLQWVAAGDLKVGDSLIGLDEEVRPGRRLRRSRTTLITALERGQSEVVKISFSDGSTVKVTKEHPWLISQRNRTFGLSEQGGSSWVKSKDLKIGQKIYRLFDTWTEDQSKEAGYLAGFFDGEGHVTGSDSGSIRVGAAQRYGSTLDYVTDLLDTKGFRTKRKSHKRLKDSHICNFTIQDGAAGCAKFLGSIRPRRLLEKFKPEMLGPVWRHKHQPLEIVSIEDLGQQEIVRISTSTRTYILEGFAAHNSDHYDYPRVSKHVRINGLSLDGMIAWHILNSSLDKGLGFVAPFYVQNTLMWKHLGDSSPAYYNAKDAHITLLCWEGIKRDLIANNLWHVYERHWIRLSEALKYMSDTGVLLDGDMRASAEAKMSTLLDGIEAKMEETVPKEARKWKIAKKMPKVSQSVLETAGVKTQKELSTEQLNQALTQMGWEVSQHEYPQKFCGTCGLSLKTRWKLHQSLCESSFVETLMIPQTVWARPLEFKISKVGMQGYQKALRHQAILNRHEKKVTFDEDAIVKLMKKYPSDHLYPLIIEHRKVQKLLSTYVGITLPNGRLHGGMPVGKDDRIHTSYGRNANTLRFTSEDPNLQNLPRPKGPDDLATIIRNLIIAAPGNILYARDFSGIEAVLTGYFALDPKYIRLAKQDVHTYYTVYAIYELEGPTGRVRASDLPDIDWPDDKLFPALAELKGRFKSDRNNLYKHLVHAANFMQGAYGARDKIFSETRIEYPVKTVQKVMDVYYALFPKIRTWHSTVLDEAEKDGFLRNPFDYVCRFSRVYDYKWEFGEWKAKPGADSNRAIAFKPQSTAVGIITEAILRLYFDHYEEAGQFLRLQVHDELFLESPRERWQEIDRIVRAEMERPVPQLKVPPSWNMGDCLQILTEAKVDLSEIPRWGSMRGIPNAA